MKKKKEVRKDFVKSLRQICRDRVYSEVDLGRISWWKIGGRASLFVSLASVEEVVAVRKLLSLSDFPSVVIGETTNLLFSDGRVDAVVLQISDNLGAVTVDGTTVSAGSGISASQLSEVLASANLTGGEHFCDIPGSLGGLIAMNGGSKRLSISNSLISVDVVTPQGSLKSVSAQDCRFTYRGSIFQDSDDVIVGATLKFEEGPGVDQIKSKMSEIRSERRNKFPSDYPNCGSVFKSSPELYESVGPPGQIIESMGLRGARIGDASVSERHGNFFENLGQATAEDMLTLICSTRRKVKEETGFDLATEVRFVSNDGRIAPVDQFCSKA